MLIARLHDVGVEYHHVNDGFVFLGHRIIRKRGSHGRMAVVTTIPKEKAKAFTHKLSKASDEDDDTGPDRRPAMGAEFGGSSRARRSLMSG